MLVLFFKSIYLAAPSLSWEKDMAPHSSILAWRIPWTEKPGGLQSMVSRESDTTCTHTHTPHNQYH